jgi:GT2 family glycosyltransferase
VTGAEPAVVVAVLTCHNRRELTLRALRSWFGQADPDVVLRAVLVDDGSVDGTADAVRQQFPVVNVLPADGTLFWAAGMALAERHARLLDPDALVWLNDDVVLADGCLGELMRVSASRRPAAVVAGALADPTTGCVSYGGFAPSRWHPLRGRTVGPAGRPLDVAAAHGNLLYVPRAALHRAAIDGEFQHSYADFDYTMRLTALSHPVVLTPHPVGWCSVTTTSRRRPDSSLPLRDRLRALNSPRGLPLRSHARFLRRHGGPLWPVQVLAPYVKEVFHGRGRPRRSRRRRPQR